MALSFVTILALAVTTFVTPEEGMGLPVPGSSESHGTVAPHKVRTKRCSCSNWLDKECIYFCHLDIIWVNTPSKTLPYGLGSPLSRRRRSTNRCKCTRSTDRTCADFCYGSTEGPAVPSMMQNPQNLNVPMGHSNLLTSLRQVIQANTQAMERGRGYRKTPAKIGRPYSR